MQLQESVRGCDVFLVQPTCSPVNENLMELFIMIDACRRASARSITVVIPYFGYARADRKVLAVISSYLVIQIQNLTLILKKEDYFEVNCILFLNLFHVLEHVNIIYQQNKLRHLRLSLSRTVASVGNLFGAPTLM